jgi:subtilisin family serine protease
MTSNCYNYRRVRTTNYWSRGVMESGVYYNQPIQLSAGLSGAGQIIGVSDTGLDLFSTYFYDNVTIERNAKTPNLKHRKVVSYSSLSGNISYGDTIDDGEMHGTHGRVLETLKYELITLL